MRFERALIVDDEATSRSVLRHLLELGGMEVAEAADGRQGLEMALDLEPDLVVTDIRMPGMTGVRLAERIRGEATLSELVLVAVTRHPEDARNGQDHLFDLVLRKPVSATRLRQWLQSVA